jgi:vacuolar protein-sorting-associated protein 4
MSGTDADRLDLGVKALLDKAIELDRRGLQKEACRYYLRTSKILIKLSNSASLPSLQKHYLNRAQECVDRVRYISGIKTKTTGRLEVPNVPLPFPAERSEPRSVDRKPSENDQVDEDVRHLQEMIADTILTERPDLKMSEVAGLEDAKQAIQEAILSPMKHPELFKGKARQPWKGILFYGPSGCGKTLIAKAVACEVHATFFNVSAGNIVSKWLGESEKLIMTLFDMARKNQPSVIFMDELDSVGVSRTGHDVGGERRLKTQLLTELQGLASNPDERVTVIGATNLPWELDFALRSRFEKKIHIPLPGKSSRRRIFEIHMEDIDVSPEVDFDELADLTEGYSGRDIGVVCRETAMEPIRDLQRTGKLDHDGAVLDLRPVSRQDFLRAIENIGPGTPPEDIRRYIDWGEAS